jgi:CBS domain-containing protein
MKTIGQLIHGQENQVWSVSPGDSVHDAVELLVEKNIGALLVMEKDKLVGLLSERDCARKTLLSDLPASETTVESIMTSQVVYAKLTHTINECMALMTDKHIRHLPIMEDDEVICMISLGDLVKTVISEQQMIIEQLEHYISG